MAALAALFHGLLAPGDRALIPSDGYFTTRLLAEKYLMPGGVSVESCATAALAARDLAGYRGYRGYRLVLIETPSNPGLDIADLRDVAARAHAAGALVAVDNTAMTPLGQRPLDLGADIVVSADTKAVSGHSDVLLGHVAARDASLIDAVRDWRRIAGAIPGPFEAWLVHRGLETLEVRFARMCASARTIAQRLAAHPRVEAVRYPGLPSHPAHALARAQMQTFGSLLGVTLADAAAAERFIDACPLIRAATSFGGIHTSAERRARWGDAVAPGYVRLSIGCEPTETLWDAIEQSLAALQEAPSQDASTRV
jgi:cystathionine gamma-lyase